MRRFTRQCLFLLLTMPFAAALADERLEGLEEQAFREAAVAAAPAIVRIQTVGGLDVINGLLTPSGPTTGVVVGEDGWIITSSFNFASQPASILVTLPNGQRYPADIVASDSSRRLTLLKIDADGLEAIKPADAGSVQVGQWTIALGRTSDQPFPNVAVGIVSAVGRIYGRAVQTDANISPKNYGGPLVNIRGEAIGILVPLNPENSDETAGVEWYDSGIGFAVPMAAINNVLPRLQSGEDLSPGLMGISFAELGVTAGQPVLKRVRPGSPAYEAGLREGDIIARIDDVETPRVPHVRQELGTKYAGDAISVSYLREESVTTVDLTLTSKLEAYVAPQLGILPDRASQADDGAPGVIVRFVLPDTPADEAGLERRDRITAIDGVPVANAKELREVISHDRPSDQIELTVVRGASEESVIVTLTEMTADVPEQLPSHAVSESNTPRDEAIRTGRWVDVLGGDESRAYWAYVPDAYHPEQAQGLVVWLHPAGDTMESDVLKLWQPICDRRGLILVGPKTSDQKGWTPSELDFVTDLVEEIREQYTIDPQRIVVHGYADAGALTAYAAFQQRDVFRGVSIAGAPLRVRPPEVKPEHPLQLHFTIGADDPAFKSTEESVEILRTAMFPTSLLTIPEHGHEYATIDAIEAIARWIDALDRI
ncbi:MAG: PDZ domain-containing protein [Planctomycetaceae bacterium]|nr:PDZ domain-containing protein [Planctomycetaceae bacterium]